MPNDSDFFLKSAAKVIHLNPLIAIPLELDLDEKKVIALIPKIIAQLEKFQQSMPDREWTVMITEPGACFFGSTPKEYSNIQVGSVVETFSLTITWTQLLEGNCTNCPRRNCRNRELYTTLGVERTGYVQ